MQRGVLAAGTAQNISRGTDICAEFQESFDERCVAGGGGFV